MRRARSSSASVGVLATAAGVVGGGSGFATWFRANQTSRLRCINAISLDVFEEAEADSDNEDNVDNEEIDEDEEENDEENNEEDDEENVEEDDEDEEEDEIARLDALCEISGIGLVTFDLEEPSTPRFRVVVRPKQHHPDLFYTNRYLALIERELFS